ncbi:MAG: endonuclease [Lachnospiraceae bacterium]|nr:endonuclease [Lachnospiraceae bacterium]
MKSEMKSEKKKPLVLRILKIAGIVIGAAVLLAVGFFAFISITEFKPKDVEPIEFTAAEKVLANDEVTLFSWNIGYGGLDSSMDFVLDYGTQVNPRSKQQVKDNLDVIQTVIDQFPSDFYFLQEIDYKSRRSYRINEIEYLMPNISTKVFARNFVCKCIPYPWPILGKMDSGLITMTDYKIDQAKRIQLPIPFKWPESMFNLKRCLEVSYVPLDGTDKQLVLVNLHLEAYDDGEGKAAQREMLINVLKEEYDKGNYVIAGGDFNHWFPGTDKIYGVSDNLWQPAYLEESDIPADWSFAYDSSVPTCRSIHAPYDGSDNWQVYVIDGFILSPNVELESIKTYDYHFANSDHNPVQMKVKLK